MRKRRSILLTVLPLLVLGGLVYAGAHLQASRHAGTFICPLTGQELPCPRCHPDAYYPPVPDAYFPPYSREARSARRGLCRSRRVRLA